MVNVDTPPRLVSPPLASSAKLVVRPPKLPLIRPDGHIAARAPFARAGAITTCLEAPLRIGRVSAA